MTRRVVAGTVGALIAAATVVAAAPAEAAAYRFWSYWKVVNGTWTFSPVGAGARVVDGAVDGWRFAVSPDSAHALQPRFNAADAFAANCGGVPPAPNAIRVAVVVDYGTPDHAPAGQSPPGGPTGWCAVLPANATGLDALAHATSYRTEGGLLCAITGYPVGECGVVVDTTTPPPPSPPAPALAAPPSQQPATSAPANNSAPPRVSAPAPSAASALAPTPAAPSTPHPPAASSTPTDTAAATAPTTSASSAPAASSEEERTSLAPVPVARRDDDGGGTPLGVLIGGTLVAGLCAAAFWQMRRRRSTP